MLLTRRAYLPAGECARVAAGAVDDLAKRPAVRQQLLSKWRVHSRRHLQMLPRQVQRPLFAPSAVGSK